MNKTYYPVKILLDEYKKPFIPFVTSNSILLPEEEGTIQDALNNRYTKEEVDAIIQNLGTLQRLCGRVDTKEDLPEDVKPGDTYIVGTTGANASEYMYIGDAWEELGPMIDLSAYYTTDEIDGLIAAVNANITTATNNINNKLKDYIKTVGGIGPDSNGNVNVNFNKYDALIDYLTYGHLYSNWLPRYSYSDIQDGNAYYVTIPYDCELFGWVIPNTTNYNEYHLWNESKQQIANLITTDNPDKVIVWATLPYGEMEYCYLDLSTGRFYKEEMPKNPMDEVIIVDSELNYYAKYNKATRTILFDYADFRYSWGQRLCAQNSNTDGELVYYYAVSQTLPTSYTFLGNKLAKLDDGLVQSVNWNYPDSNGNVTIRLPEIPEIDLTKYDAINKYLTDGAVEEVPIIFNDTTLWYTDWAEGEYTKLPEDVHYLKLPFKSGAKAVTKLSGYYREIFIAETSANQVASQDYINMQVVNPDNYDNNVSTPFNYNPETGYYESYSFLDIYPFISLFNRVCSKDANGDIIIDLDEYNSVINGGFEGIVVSGVEAAPVYYLIKNKINPTEYNFLSSYLEKVDELYENSSNTDDNTNIKYIIGQGSTADNPEKRTEVVDAWYQEYKSLTNDTLNKYTPIYLSEQAISGRRLFKLTPKKAGNKMYLTYNPELGNTSAYRAYTVNISSGHVISVPESTDVTGVSTAVLYNSYKDYNFLDKKLKDYMTLGVNNTQEYTPTGAYNPATKKYVDDAIKALPGVEPITSLNEIVSKNAELLIDYSSTAPASSYDVSSALTNIQFKVIFNDNVEKTITIPKTITKVDCSVYTDTNKTATYHNVAFKLTTDKKLGVATPNITGDSVTTSIYAGLVAQDVIDTINKTIKVFDINYPTYYNWDEVVSIEQI